MTTLDRAAEPALARGGRQWSPRRVRLDQRLAAVRAGLHRVGSELGRLEAVGREDPLAGAPRAARRHVQRVHGVLGAERHRLRLALERELRASLRPPEARQ